MRRAIQLMTAVMLALAPAPLWAWPVWIVPSDWRPKAPGPVTFTIYSQVVSGESSAPMTRDGLESAIAVDALGRRDLLTKLPAGAQLPLRVRTAGSTVIAIRTKPVVETVPGDDFDGFLKRNFPELLKSRDGHRGEDVILTTSSLAKSVVQVGGKATPNYFAPLGESLELVPLDDPFASTETMPTMRARALESALPAPGTRVVGVPLYGANAWGPSRIYGPQIAPATGEDSWVLFPGDGGMVYRVMELKPSGDGVHFALQTATLALRMANGR